MFMSSFLHISLSPIYNKAATTTATAPTNPRLAPRPQAPPVAVAVTVTVADAAVEDVFSDVEEPLMILTDVPLFWQRSAAGAGAEAEKVISAHLGGVSCCLSRRS